MSIRLLETVCALVYEAAQRGDRATVNALVYEAISERVRVMHERAQAAEGRAARAETRLQRLSMYAGVNVP